MATLIKKEKKGKAYWYAVESQRVDGKPRIVWQKYLGRIDDIVAAVGQPQGSRPKEVEILGFGGVAALLGAAKQLDLVNIINRHVRKRNQGPSIGQFMLLAAINRAVAPSSKLQIGDWYQKTILRRLWRFSADKFNSQRFWDAMDKVSPEAVIQIEKDIVSKLVKSGLIDSDLLLYDTTNFATYISLSNERNTIAQKGHSKKKRRDLRIVGYAQIVAKGSRIPLFHQVYPGNHNDQTTFRDSVLQLVERYKQVKGLSKADLTIVFDKGNRGADTFDILDDSEIYFVSTLMRTHYLKFLEGIPASDFRPLSSPELPGVKAYRCKMEVNGVERTAVVKMSDTFYSAEISHLASDLAKAITKLNQLAADLRKENKKKKSGSRPTITGTENKVKLILARHKLSKNVFSHKTESIIDYNVGNENGRPVLTYSVNQEILNKRMSWYSGRTILFTNRHDWSTEEIILAYRNQYEIEDTFRHMNNWDYLRWQPMFHWTDQKIRTHGFYCYLAVLLTALVKQKIDQALTISTHEMLDKLNDMKETLLIYPQDGKATPPKLQRAYSKLDLTQLTIAEQLDLKKWQI